MEIFACRRVLHSGRRNAGETGNRESYRQGRRYVLRHIADAITQAAQPRYNHPFKFYLVHETQPNAFATPGGNVYVVDSLLYFVKNTEELAGTLCHEVSHTIHHDTVTLMEKQRQLEKREVGTAVLLGPTRAHVLAILLLGKLHSPSYSRDVESRADLTSSDVCAATGYDPWGLVWLFQDFRNAQIGQIRQLLSDHPDDQNRVQTLKEHFYKKMPRKSILGAIALPLPSCRLWRWRKEAMV